MEQGTEQDADQRAVCHPRDAGFFSFEIRWVGEALEPPGERTHDSLAELSERFSAWRCRESGIRAPTSEKAGILLFGLEEALAFPGTHFDFSQIGIP